MAFRRSSVRSRSAPPTFRIIQRDRQVASVKHGCSVVGAREISFRALSTEHRFENFSDDLAVWVMFYGPEGGES